MAIFQGLPNLEGIKRLYLLFFYNHSPTKPNICDKFEENRRFELYHLLPASAGFLMDALFIFQAGSENYHIVDIVLVL